MKGVRGLKVQELMDYLSQFSKDSNISMIIANPSKDARQIYPVSNFFMMDKDDDNEKPCFIVEVEKSKPLDEFVLDEDGQLRISEC